VISVPVCLSVHSNMSTNYYPWPWLDPSLTAMRYVTYFRFLDDVIFSYNRANVQNKETTCMFRRVRQMAVLGAKSAVSDCIKTSRVKKKSYSDLYANENLHD